MPIASQGSALPKWLVVGVFRGLAAAGCWSRIQDDSTGKNGVFGTASEGVGGEKGYCRREKGFCWNRWARPFGTL